MTSVLHSTLAWVPETELGHQAGTAGAFRALPPELSHYPYPLFSDCFFSKLFLDEAFLLEEVLKTLKLFTEENWGLAFE